MRVIRLGEGARYDLASVDITASARIHEMRFAYASLMR
jgi:hypothetical protein